MAARFGLAAAPACATCHAQQSATQPGTPMARALPQAASNPAFKSGPLKFTDGKFTWAIETRGDRTTYSVTDGARTIALPVDWVFGAESQTFVLNRQGIFYESMVSYYVQTRALAITVGDASLNPQTVEEAIGRRLTRSVITACFNCHATNSVTNNHLDLQSLVHGVQCERCHTEAAAHLKTISGARPSQAMMPEKLSARSAESMSGFCGQCHRTWETVVRNNWRGESNVRFQPYRLANSKCFDGADPRISCVACHNPHQNLIVDDARYDQNCLSCHNAKTKMCPVSQSGCVACHMPKVKLPGGSQVFTDHDIRVVKSGEPYPN